MKTERKAKISFIKMGTGKGCKVNLSIPLLKEFGINEDNREVKISPIQPIKSYKACSIILSRK